MDWPSKPNAKTLLLARETEPFREQKLECNFLKGAVYITKKRKIIVREQQNLLLELNRR